MEAKTILFARLQEVVRVSGSSLDFMCLEVLGEDLGCTGKMEGFSVGDCGTCIVVAVKARDRDLRYLAPTLKAIGIGVGGFVAIAVLASKTEQQPWGATRNSKTIKKAVNCSRTKFNSIGDKRAFASCRRGVLRSRRSCLL